MTAARRQNRRVQRGFTLIEVMMALSILAVALIGLISRTSANIRLTQEAGMLDVATELARSKMYDIEAQLLHDGFSEMAEEDSGDFGDEGWPNIRWEVSIDKIELPNLGAMESMQGQGEDGEGGGDGEKGSGSMIDSFMGGLGGGEGEGGMGMISPFFELITQVLEVSIRKVTLKLEWNVGQEKKSTVVACYFTDPVAMNQAIPNLGSLGGNTPGTTTPGTTTPGNSNRGGKN